MHIYKDGKLIAKWDLENFVVMEGAVNRRLRKLIRELVKEGKL
ncbi:MAG: hypothetical protein HYR96_07685 [Deltaproteobacteria bacterium]|nr:hypothetical protein [Deltaproteobacteria bacterium]MBI3293171.1 hypothetical protein [Deltaproteobacteria bacterium]